MPSIVIPGLPAGALSQPLEQMVIDAVTLALDTTPLPSPEHRVGPDLTFIFEADNGSSRRLQLIADGAYLRDPKTLDLWPFPPGKRMLNGLAVARGIKDPEP
jgi:hypothetical protein